MLTDLTDDVLHHVFRYVSRPKDIYHAYASCQFMKTFVKDNMRDIHVDIRKQNDVKVLKLVPNIARIHLYRCDDTPFDFDWCRTGPVLNVLSKQCEKQKLEYIFVNSVYRAGVLPTQTSPSILYGFGKLPCAPKNRRDKLSKKGEWEEPDLLNIKEYFMKRFESRKNHRYRFGGLSHSI